MFSLLFYCSRGLLNVSLFVLFIIAA